MQRRQGQAPRSSDLCLRDVNMRRSLAQRARAKRCGRASAGGVRPASSPASVGRIIAAAPLR
jgi:hypothetical protein